VRRGHPDRLTDLLGGTAPPSAGTVVMKPIVQTPKWRVSQLPSGVNSQLCLPAKGQPKGHTADAQCVMAMPEEATRRWLPLV
jgi:hypothetical protein